MTAHEPLDMAVEKIRAAVGAAKPMYNCLSAALAELGVDENAVRAHFLRAHGVTLEEYERQHIQHVTIDAYLQQYRESHHDIDAKSFARVGARFTLVVDGPDGTDVESRQRFLRAHGKMIVCIDEVTYRMGEVMDEEIIDDIARQIGWKRWSHWPEPTGPGRIS